MRFHPLETVVQGFLSSDSQLLPETIKQIHLLETWFVLTGLGVLSFLFFFKHWQSFPSRKAKRILFLAIFIIAGLLRVVSTKGAFESMNNYDGVHYTVGAAELARSGQLTLPINGDDHPISKAPGFSLLLAPFYLVFKDNLGAAVFCPLLLGLLSLFFLYALAKKRLGEQEALLGFLLFSLAPLPIISIQYLLPSMGPLFFVLAATLFLIKKNAGWKSLWMAGLLFGFAAVVRYFAVAAIPAALVFLLSQQGKDIRDRLKQIFGFSAGALLPLAGLFYYQWKVFGSPWLTGYSYWEAPLPMGQKHFSAAFAFGIPPSSGGSSNFLFNLVSATGAYIPLPNILASRPDQIAFAVLIWIFAACGVFGFYRKDRPLFFFAAVFFLFYYFFHLFLFSQTAHFMLPVVPFVLLAAAVGMAHVLKRLPRKIYYFGYKVLLLGVLSFIPFAYSYSHQPFSQAPRQEFLELIQTHLPVGAALVTDFDPILFTHLVGRPRKMTTIAPSQGVLYADRPRYFRGKILPPALWGAVDHLEKLQALLEEGKPVYLARFLKGECEKDYQKIFGTFLSSSVAQSENYQLFKLGLH